jgi:hypothetical protein
MPYGGKFEKKEYTIEKKKSELKDNSNIECTFKIKNISKEKKWKKGFSIKIKYKNEDDIQIIEGDKIEEEVDLNSIINKNITFLIGDLEKKNYIFDLYIINDKNNTVKNCSTNININIIDDENNLKIKIDDSDIEEIFRNLCEGYNIENMGIKIDKLKGLCQEYSKTINDNINKEEFIDGLTAFIIDKLY